MPDAELASPPAGAADLRLLVIDVDGVLTDGTLYYGPDGEVLKAFHVRDGLGVKLLQRAGIPTAVITAKDGAPLERRLADIGVEHVWMGCEDKSGALDSLLERLGLDVASIGYVGDDLTDLPVLRRVGVPITVADAHSRVRAECAWVTQARGGRGAVREVCEGVLAAKGLLDAVVDDYLADPEGTGATA